MTLTRRVVVNMVLQLGFVPVGSIHNTLTPGSQSPTVRVRAKVVLVRGAVAMPMTVVLLLTSVTLKATPLTFAPLEIC